MECRCCSPCTDAGDGVLLADMGLGATIGVSMSDIAMLRSCLSFLETLSDPTNLPSASDFGGKPGDPNRTSHWGRNSSIGTG